MDDRVLAPTSYNVANWLRSASASGEDWAYATRTDGGIVAVDEVTEEGMRKPRQAVTYPAPLSQLSSWWLSHAWRGNDLICSAVEDLGHWRLTTAPLPARALLEQVGCLVHQSATLFKAWADCKSLTVGSVDRLQEI